MFVSKKHVDRIEAALRQAISNAKQTADLVYALALIVNRQDAMIKKLIEHTGMKTEAPGETYIECEVEEVYETISGLRDRVSFLEEDRSKLKSKISGLRQIVARGSAHHETCGMLRFEGGVCDCGYEELMDPNR